MKITDLEIDGFGAWSHLRLDDLPGHLTVFFGPNEAGKTTLLQFIRSVFFGVSPDRMRYLPPLDGGPAGGRIGVQLAEGHYQIHRRMLPGRPEGDRIEVHGTSGAVQDAAWLQTALQDVDEATFNNIFAIGLGELQELSTLTATEASAWLYRLTLGVDRVSLVDVMQRLAAGRNRVIAPDGDDDELTRLLAQRAHCVAKLEGLPTTDDLWVDVSQRQTELEQRIEQLKAERQHLTREAKRFEVAVELRDQWQRRAALERELAATSSDGRRLPPGGIAHMERLTKRYQRLRDQRKRHVGEYRQIREELRQLATSAIYARHGSRIELLADQLDWVTTLERQLGGQPQESADVAAALDRQQVAAQAAAQVAAPTTVKPSDGNAELARRALATLKLPARRLRLARQELATAEQRAASCHKSQAATDDEVRARLAGQDEADLPAAVERAGRLAAQLRRRVALDQRLDEIARQQEGLDEQIRELLEQQILPISAIVVLGGLFIVGVTMMLSSFWFPQSVLGGLGRTFALLGVLGTAASGVLKFFLERATTTRLDSCRKQLDTLTQQALEAKAERNALDRELPQGGGPLTRRLQAAERELEALERLLPLDTQRHSVAREIAAADQALTTARQELDQALSAWRHQLSAAGLPTDLTPGRVRSLAQQPPQLVPVPMPMPVQVDSGRDIRALRRLEYEALTGRIRRLAVDLGIASEGRAASELMRRILAQWEEQRPNVQRRAKLHRHASRLRRQVLRLTRRLERLADARRALLTEAGVYSPSEFRQLALKQAHNSQLQRQRDAVAAEIRTAIDGLISDADLAQLYGHDSQQTLEARWDQTTDRLSEIDSSHNQCLKELGALGQRQEDLAQGRRRAETQLELACVEQRLQAAIEQWQVHAATWQLLDDVRREYERQRQPETLLVASPYVEQLTEGRYVRVWTPLDADVLYVDDRQQRTLPVDALSRGTREQLLLCLRLALIAGYADRGVHLPVVLDDVLVNFDAARAKAAARLLRDFANDGHQLLLMTCHEHIWQIFRSLHVDTRALLNATIPDEPEFEPISEIADEIEPDDEEEEEQEREGGVGEIVVERPLVEASSVWEEVEDDAEQIEPLLIVLEETEEVIREADDDVEMERELALDTVEVHAPVDEPLSEPSETVPPPSSRPAVAAPQRMDNGQWVRIGPLVRRVDAAAVPPRGIDM